VLFSAAFMFLFYLAMFLSVPEYHFEPIYALFNVLFFAGILFMISILPGPGWLYTFFCYIVLLVPTIVVSSYIRIYKNPFNFNTFYFLWGTNQAETREFLQYMLHRLPSLPIWVGFCGVLPILFWVILSRSLKKFRVLPLRKRLILLGASACFLVPFVWFSRVYTFNYAFNFYLSYFRYQKDTKFVVQASERSKERIQQENVISAYPADVRETYVIVIGESASRHHWGLYGYPRPTTPLMNMYVNSGDAFAFNNVNSTSIATLTSLLPTLTFLTQGSTLYEHSYSIVDVFNGAGFKTWWFSNNAILGATDTFLQVLSKNATVRKFTAPQDIDVQSMQFGSKSRNFENLMYDSLLLPWLDDALTDNASKKVVFLHLKGSHIIYRYRYPASWDYFTGSDDITSSAARTIPDAIPLINQYDNSIRYTDAILDAVIQRVARSGGQGWVLYFSDHGEDLFDLGETAGRDVANANKYMLDVPFVAWFSEDYRRTHDVERFRAWADRPYRLDDTIHSIIDIAGLKTWLLDPSRSIFSNRYKMRARAVFNRLYLDYPPESLNNPNTYRQERALGRLLLEGIGEL